MQIYYYFEKEYIYMVKQYLLRKNDEDKIYRKLNIICEIKI